MSIINREKFISILKRNNIIEPFYNNDKPSSFINEDNPYYNYGDSDSNLLGFYIYLYVLEHDPRMYSGAMKIPHIKLLRQCAIFGDKDYSSNNRVAMGLKLAKEQCEIAQEKGFVQFMKDGEGPEPAITEKGIKLRKKLESCIHEKFESSLEDFYPQWAKYLLLEGESRHYSEWFVEEIKKQIAGENHEKILITVKEDL